MAIVLNLLLFFLFLIFTSFVNWCAFLQSFGDLVHRPLLVDLTVEEGQRLKVIYGSCAGFHAVDVDSGAVYDIYLPTHVRSVIVLRKCNHSVSSTITVYTELRDTKKKSSNECRLQMVYFFGSYFIEISVLCILIVGHI